MTPAEKTQEIKNSIPEHVTLVVVSKTYAPDKIMEVYNAGQRIFGENRVQEMTAKYEVMPKDIKWRLIGQLQRNKVKYIARFVDMIESVDSDRLLAVINKESAKNNRTIDVLLQLHVAVEETKSGWDIDELKSYIASGAYRQYANVRIRGLMTIASLTDDLGLVKKEFDTLKNLFDYFKANYFGEQFDTLSMGMTSDYEAAIEAGSNNIRIGSLIFGARRMP